MRAMPQFVSSHASLFFILLLALLIRLPGVPYGLPDHLIADEEVNVYSALQMIQLKTLLPVFHPDEFKILYSPPMLAYVYLLFFIPTLGIMYVFSGMPPTSAFADMLILDPSLLWIVGRLVNVGISLGALYLLYRIAHYLFANRTIAITSSLLLATSFIDVTLAATTRHWALGTCLSLLSLFFVLRYAHSAGKRTVFIILSGATLGLSFATSYLVYYAPFIGLLLLYLHWKDTQSLDPRSYIRPALLFGIPFLVVAAISILVAPQPFNQQVVTHFYADRHTISQFLWFYAQTLLNFETPIFIASLIGLCGLLQAKKYELLAIVGTFFITTLPIMFVFLWDLERYIQPLLPILALIGGYGIYAVRERFQPRITLFILVILFVLYTGTVFGRYAHVALQNDTKIQAKNWILSNIRSESLLIVDSERMRFTTTPSAATFASEIDAGWLRAADRVVLETSRVESDSYHAFHMSIVTPTKQKVVLEKILSFPTKDRYLVTDSWSSTIVARALTNKEPVAVFPNGSTTLVPTGLYIGGEEHISTNTHLLSLLWKTKYFGPDVYVYRIE